MNTLQKFLTMLIVAVGLVACGGSENAGTSAFGTGSGGSTGDTGTAAADLIVTLSTAQLANTGSATADVSVTAIDAYLASGVVRPASESAGIDWSGGAPT